jgi:hypothetical protein
MWNFLMAFFIGSAIGRTRVAQRLLKPVLMLVAFGILISGLIYTYVFVTAALERSHDTHVHTLRSY